MINNINREHRVLSRHEVSWGLKKKVYYLFSYKTFFRANNQKVINIKSATYYILQGKFLRICNL